MAEVKMFGTRLSPFVEKVSRALELKGVAFDLVPPAGPRDFAKWNPQTGKMPVLEINGQRLYDSTFIVRRLDELYPEPPLLARDPAVAAQQRLLEDWSDESLYWYVMALRWTEDHREATTNQILETLPAYIAAVARLFLPRQIRSTTVAQGLGRLPQEETLHELGERLDDLVTILDGKPFFYSDSVSVADLAIFGQLNTARSGPTPDAEELIRARPAISDLMKRVEAVTQGAS